MRKLEQIISIDFDKSLVLTESSDASQFWDMSQATEVLGRSRRTIARYIECGYLRGIKVSGACGPEWRIVPFSVRRASELIQPELPNHLERITRLEAELQRLREQQREDSHQLSLPTEAANEVNPGLLQAVVAFFTITGVKLGLASRATH
ncbi:MAG: hypothetical protein Q8T09_02880 [Candidatus Melainabacteria bacterium]|nr:hypothetical protein [Candidatus Melainabacteria bacterium]